MGSSRRKGVVVLEILAESGPHASEVVNPIISVGPVQDANEEVHWQMSEDSSSSV